MAGAPVFFPPPASGGGSVGVSLALLLSRARARCRGPMRREIELIETGGGHCRSGHRLTANNQARKLKLGRSGHGCSNTANCGVCLSRPVRRDLLPVVFFLTWFPHLPDHLPPILSMLKSPLYYRAAPSWRRFFLVPSCRALSPTRSCRRGYSLGCGRARHRSSCGFVCCPVPLSAPIFVGPAGICHRLHVPGLLRQRHGPSIGLVA